MAVPLKRSAQGTNSESQPRVKMPKTEGPEPSTSSDENGGSGVTSAVKRLINANQKPATDKNLLSPAMMPMLSVFPWLDKFSKICFQSIGISTLPELISLMTNFKNHVTQSAEECALKPNRAGKLRRILLHYIVFFRFIYIDCKEPFLDTSYLELMSDLLATLIDMELKASKKSKELLNSVANRILLTSYFCLEDNQDFVVDSLLKTKFMCKAFSELSSLIFGEILKESPGKHAFDLTYVRYILAFKMWKKSVKEPEERKKIIQLAKDKLFAPPKFKDKVKSGFLNKVLPNIPKNVEDITFFLIKAKFDIKSKVQVFLKTQHDGKNNFFFDASFATDLDRVLLFEDPVDPADEDKLNGPVMNDIWDSLNPEVNINDYLKYAQVTSVAKMDRLRAKRKKKALIAKRKAAILKKKAKLAKEEPIEEDDQILDSVPMDTDTEVKAEVIAELDKPVQAELNEPVKALENIPKDPIVNGFENNENLPIMNHNEVKTEEPIDLRENHVQQFNFEVENEEPVGLDGRQLKEIIQLIDVDTLENDLVIASEPEMDPEEESVVPQPYDYGKEIQDIPKENPPLESYTSEPNNADILKEKIIEGKSPEKIKRLSREENQSLIDIAFSIPYNGTIALSDSPLHAQTAHRDNTIFSYQKQLRELMNNNVPFPILDRTPIDKFKTSMFAAFRCMCIQCVENNRRVIQNAESLALFMTTPDDAPPEEPTIPTPPPPPSSSAEKNKDTMIIEEHPNLPIKKRYSIATTVKDDQPPSYPATPMMSIAALEKVSCCTEPLNLGSDISYSPQSPPPQPSTSSKDRCKFKTPAQLKEVMYPPQKTNGRLDDRSIGLSEYENIKPYSSFLPQRKPEAKKEKKRSSRSGKSSSSRKKKY